MATVDKVLNQTVELAQRGLAEKELVRLAEHHDARELHQLGKRILDVVAPEIGEAQQRRALERETRAAAQACRFTLSDDGNGTCHGRFLVPSAVGAMLKKAVLAIAAPKHRAAQGPARLDLPGPQRLGQAFGGYVER